MARGSFTIIVFGPDRLPLDGAQVTLRDADNVDALVYAARTGGSPIDNPLETGLPGGFDQPGTCRGFVEWGAYKAICDHESLGAAVTVDLDVVSGADGAVAAALLDTVPGSKVTDLAIAHAWARTGLVRTTDYYGELPIFLRPGQTAKLRRVFAKTQQGTATFSIRVNGSAPTGYSGKTATTSTGVLVDGSSPVTLDDLDLLELVVTAISGTPKGLVVGVEIDKG